MTQSRPGSKLTDDGDEASRVPTSPSDLDQERRTSMAAERTWLAWWRTALGATAGALAVGRFAPKLLDVAPWPYILLGCGYASLAVGLSIVGAQRQRQLEHALKTDGHAPLGFRTVALFTIGGVVLALLTVVLVIAQT
jgi:putative membrane protein